MNISSVSTQDLPLFKSSLLKKIPWMEGKKLLVVGDLGLDQYVHGEVRRISPEAPVPILEVTNEDKRLGLATNVAQNVASLGGIPLLVGVVGNDQASEELKKLLQAAKVSTEYLVIDQERPTTRKLRLMSGHHHLLRVDFETRKFLSPKVENLLLQQVRSLVLESDGVILEDYAKGVVSENCAQLLVQICREARKPLMVDPNRLTPSSYYRGCTLMTPNQEEGFALAGVHVSEIHQDPHSLQNVAQFLMKNLNLEHLVITQGQNGISLFSEQKVIHLPTYARQVFDVTGAGDTVIAALALSWVSGFSLQEACILSNFAAGVVVGKVGCVPCEREELIRYINETTQS